ncbi:MAG TPA: cytochrome P450, partial [Polyangiales bacterium]
MGVVLPRFAPMRKLVDWVVYKGEHRTRRIAGELEQLLFEFAVPSGPDTWFADLLQLKASGAITSAQFRGEVTAMLVSAFSLSAAMSSMLLCLAARSDYIPKLREDDRLLKCFVSEVLRLYPPFRQFGYEPKGIWDKPRKERAAGGPTDLIVTIFALHRNANEWEDPDEFRPERFLAPKASSGHKYLPFGMGKRACSGRTYSMMLLAHVLKYLCSEACPLTLSLPPDFARDARGLPIGAPGVLISFPIDDRVLCRPKAINKNVLEQTWSGP